MTPVDYWDGTELIDVQPGVTTAAGTIVDAEAGVVPHGYSSVAQMLRQDRFYVAHRGGSANWPECSMNAYSQSVFWGAPALEFSAGRSSDGVWFGLHDQYLDRTSLGVSTTTLNPANMTWAQVQQYTINQYGKQRPYLPLVELLDAYLDTHVIFIDPKYVYVNGMLGELWPLLADFPSAQDKIVIKYSGGSVIVADLARANGYHGWGYYYDTDDLNQLVNNSGPRWDMIGMNVHNDGTFDPTAWDAALSLGKPVLGHICSSKTMSDGAWAAGASGVMVSGVKSVFENSPFTLR